MGMFLQVIGVEAHVARTLSDGKHHCRRRQHGVIPRSEWSSLSKLLT